MALDFFFHRPVTRNSPPVALDDAIDVPFRTLPSGNVLSNDTDPNGDPLSIASYTQPENGEVVVGPTGAFLFLPEIGYEGTDSFTYVVSDGRGGTDTGTVTVNVLEPYFPPRFLPARSSEDRYTATAGTPLVVDANEGVLANDISLQPIQFAFVLTEPTQGALAFNEDGSFTYTPDPGATGVDTFTYTVLSSGTTNGSTTVTIEIEEPVETLVLGRPSERVAYDGGVLAVVGFDPKFGGERTSDTVTFDWNGRDVSINTVGQFLAFVARIEHDRNTDTDAIFDGEDLAFVFSREADGSVDEALVFDGLVGEDLLHERLLAVLGADRANTTAGESDAIGPYFEPDLAIA